MEHRTNPVMATVAPIGGVTGDVVSTVAVPAAGPALSERPRGQMPVPGPTGSEDGSLVTEYGLLAVVAATLAGAVISWASNGALVTLFNALLRQARALVGA